MAHLCDVAFAALDELGMVVVGNRVGEHGSGEGVAVESGHGEVYAVDEVEPVEHLGEVGVVDATACRAAACDDVQHYGDVGHVGVVGELAHLVLLELDEDGGHGPGALALDGGEVCVPHVDVGELGEGLAQVGGDG